ncbi:unnamed protein product [Cladocopium goreaui]|uniref:Receptor-interacting serine/threonine-protein kinase 4 n=1 Tax=Cladocopium goreaui TaxID=2562237 RepID=A0A9P1FX95_9DINO|nr:unnamed protein product [Cladocopium goreaui]
MCSLGQMTQSLQTTFKGGNRLQGIYFQVDVLDDINLVSLTGSFADAGHVYVHIRTGVIGEQVGGTWRLLQSTQVESGGQKNVPIGQVLVRGSYTLHDAVSIHDVLAQDDNVVIYNGWGTADCDRIPLDRDYSGCPCRSWNGIVEYRCEVESVYRDQHLRRLVAVMHQDTDFADVEIKCGNQSFPAHRLILASASPVFAKMLQTDMKEARTRTVLIEDVDPEVVAKALPPLPSPSGVPESFNWAKGYVNKLGLVHLADSCRLAGVQKALAEELGFEPVTTSVSEPVSWKQNFMFDNHPGTSPLVAPIDFMLYGRMDDGEPIGLSLIPGYSVSVEKLELLASMMSHLLLAVDVLSLKVKRFTQNGSEV